MGLPSPAPDRTAVVTGASSGIGAEMARQLARRGHGVTLVARRGDRLAGFAEELAATGVRAEVMAADLSDRSARAGLLDRVDATGLTPYVLVNNAGLSTVGPVAASDPDAELNLVEVDVAAVADLCSRFLPGMVARGSGAVLNVASTAAFQPMPGQAAYAAAKAFVLSYTRSLGGELRGTGVTATALCPGPVETGFGEVAGLSDEEQATLPKAHVGDRRGRGQGGRGRDGPRPAGRHTRPGQPARLRPGARHSEDGPGPDRRPSPPGPARPPIPPPL